MDTLALMSYAKNSPYVGRLSAPTLTGQRRNPACADDITLEVALLPDGRVTEAKYHGPCCALCAASASLLCERLPGLTVTNLQTLSEDFLLAAFGPLSPQRMQCALLPWQTLRDGVKKYVAAHRA